LLFTVDLSRRPVVWEFEFNGIGLGSSLVGYLLIEFEFMLKDCLEFVESRKSLSVDVDGGLGGCWFLGWEVVGAWRSVSVLNVEKRGFWLENWEQVMGLELFSIEFRWEGSEGYGEGFGFEFLEQWPEIFGWLGSGWKWDSLDWLRSW
jgi:hypothetical protein